MCHGYTQVQEKASQHSFRSESPTQKANLRRTDIVRIMDFLGNQVGVGKANCDSAQAREAMGKHGKKPVVHYDYLYIE